MIFRGFLFLHGMTEFIVLNTITSLVMFLLALVFRKYRPKNINGLYGYRTRRSMRSREAWDFAQDYSSALMVKLFAGFLMWQILTTVCGVLFLKAYLEAVALISVLALLPLLIIMMVKTERQLKLKFGA